MKTLEKFVKGFKIYPNRQIEITTLNTLEGFPFKVKPEGLPLIHF